MKYRKGDIVRYHGEFLRSIGWATPPINGVVRWVKDLGTDTQVLGVEWSDGITRSVVADNVEPCPIARREAGRDGDRPICNMEV